MAGTVNFADFAKVVADYGKPASWDGGAVTYGATVSFADFALTVANYGKQAVTTTMTLAALDATPASQASATTQQASANSPAIRAPQAVSAAVQKAAPRKPSVRHR